MITLNNIAININERLDPLLEIVRGVQSNKIKDTISDLLPLLSLHKKTASLASLGMLACRITEMDWKQNKSKNIGLLAAGIAYIGFSAKAPIPSLALSSTFKVYTTLISSDSKTKKISLIAHQAIYVASIYYATPGLIALSLLSQIIAEIHAATKGFTESPSSLHDLVNFIVACARLSQVLPYAEKAYHNYYDKKPIQEDKNRSSEPAAQSQAEQKASPVKKIGALSQQKASSVIKTTLSSTPEKTTLSETELSNNIIIEETWGNIEEKWEGATHISSDISNKTYKNCLLSFGLITCSEGPKHLKISNCTFEHCRILETQISSTAQRLSRLTFSDVSLNDCNLSRQAVINFDFYNTSFNNCNLSSSTFNNCTLNNTSFSGCNLSYSVFAFSTFFNSRIISSKLEEACFWANKIQESMIEGCRLTNVFLLEAKKLFKFKECGENTFTVPIVIFPTHFDRTLRFAPRIISSMRKDNGILLLPFDTCPTDIINPTLLRQEILTSLTEIEKSSPADILSRADEVLKRAQPGSQLHLIKERAAALMKISSGLLIPGGGNIEEELYKTLAVTHHVTAEKSKNFAKTLIELGFLEKKTDEAFSDEFCNALVARGLLTRTAGSTFEEDFLNCLNNNIYFSDRHTFPTFVEFLRGRLACVQGINAATENNPFELARLFLKEWTNSPFFDLSIKDNDDDDSVELAGTISELALLQMASTLNTPTLGTCRGSQLINVFFGGTLRNVEGQHGYQELNFTESPAAAELKEKLNIQSSFIGYSNHGQAVDILGKGLDVLLKFKDIVKLVIHKSGSIIGTQFHPEQREDVTTQKRYIKDLIDEKSSHISPESHKDFIKANTAIHQLFIDKVKALYNSKKPTQGA